jgi:hypothetical protein
VQYSKRDKLANTLSLTILTYGRALSSGSASKRTTTTRSAITTKSAIIDVDDGTTTKMVTTRQRNKIVSNSAKTNSAKKKKEKAKVSRVVREKAQVAKAKAAAKVTAVNNARRAGPVRQPRPKPVPRTSPRHKTPTSAMIAAANFAQGISDDADGKPKIRSFKFVRPN